MDFFLFLEFFFQESSSAYEVTCGFTKKNLLIKFGGMAFFQIYENIVNKLQGYGTYIDMGFGDASIFDFI